MKDFENLFDTTSKYKEKLINEVMDNFNFEKVHNVMEYLNWTWHFDGVPSIDDLKDRARELLHEAYDKKAEVRTGGFRVRYNKYNEEVELLLTFEIDNSEATINTITGELNFY